MPRFLNESMQNRIGSKYHQWIAAYKKALERAAIAERDRNPLQAEHHRSGAAYCLRMAAKEGAFPWG